MDSSYSCHHLSFNHTFKQHVGQVKGHLPPQEARQGQEEEWRPGHQRAPPDQCAHARGSCTLNRTQHLELESPIHRVQPLPPEQTRCVPRAAPEARQDGGPGQAAVLAEDHDAAQRLWQRAHAGHAPDPQPVSRQEPAAGSAAAGERRGRTGPGARHEGAARPQPARGAM
jgi:hypothetical protein